MSSKHVYVILGRSDSGRTGVVRCEAHPEAFVRKRKAMQKKKELEQERSGWQYHVQTLTILL